MSISSDITRIKGAKADLKTAINAKGGTITNELIDEYADAVDAIVVGVDTSDATATADSLLYGHTAYGSDGTKLTGTLPSAAVWSEYVNQYDFRAYASTTLSITSTSAKDYCVSLENSTHVGNPSGVLQDNTTIVNATIMFPDAANFARNMCSGCTNLEEITLGSTANIVNRGAYIPFNSMFKNCAKLHTIHSALSFAGTTDNHVDPFLNCFALANITFVANSIKSNLSFEQSPLLSTASLLSIANGLLVATKTLTMHATSKTNMDNIMVDNVDGTAVLGTTMSLTTFITTIKGWTIA